VYILSVYKHNKCNDQRALEQMYNFLQTNIPRNSGASLLVLGDFNIDFNKQEEREKLEYLQNQLGLRALFEHEKTFKYKTHIDWAFKSRHFKFGIESLVYDTWFSDHSAIWTEIDFEKE
jgi:endonuclease/exonuclease/phosphatase family metal-dependent hydrolase